MIRDKGEHSATVNVTTNHLDMYPLSLMCTHTRPVVASIVRRHVSEEAAREGRARCRVREKHLRIEQELQKQQLLGTAYALRKSEEAIKQQLLAREAEQIFLRLSLEGGRIDRQREQEQEVLTQKSMVDFENKRLDVLWKVLLECDKKYFTPLECREFSRLCVHLRRVAAR